MSFPCTSSLVLAGLLAAGAVHATTVKTGKPASAPTHAWATRDQLRECLDSQASLQARFKAIEASNTTHERLFDQVEAENTKLRELQSQLDRDNDTSVGAFNALVKEHNLHVKSLNQDAADSRPASDAYNDDMAAFNHKCSQLAYRVDDLEAVTKERRKAAAAAAAASRP